MEEYIYIYITMLSESRKVGSKGMGNGTYVRTVRRIGGGKAK